jgi:hypothetical protein
MEVFRFIQRKYEWALMLGGFGRFRRARPSTPDRLCQFGHPVVSGIKLGSYGHCAV